VLGQRRRSRQNQGWFLYIEPNETRETDQGYSNSQSWTPLISISCPSDLMFGREAEFNPSPPSSQPFTDPVQAPQLYIPATCVEASIFTAEPPAVDNKR